MLFIVLQHGMNVQVALILKLTLGITYLLRRMEVQIYGDSMHQ